MTSNTTPPQKTTAPRPVGDTSLAHCGLSPDAFHGFVNPPVVHASTVLFENSAAMKPGGQRYTYGLRATPTSEALESALCMLDDAALCRLAPSGLSAVSLACLSVLKAGDHFLVTDNVYGPTRRFCDQILRPLGINVEYYDPLSAGTTPGEPLADTGLARLLRPDTAAIFLEVPGSQTFEMQDVGAVCRAARQAGAWTIVDNTWATPLFFRPLHHGADLVVQAATKYIVGHSDAMLGCVSAHERAADRLANCHAALGLQAGPDDIFLALRGLRTMRLRLERHMTSALKIGEWLQGRTEVAQVMHPAMPHDPGHALWKRDFSGAGGLFAFQLAPHFTDRHGDAFLDGLKLFGLGYSWGGFSSLAARARLHGLRTCRAPEPGPILRLFVGLEDVDDLIADLEQGFAALAHAAHQGQTMSHP